MKIVVQIKSLGHACLLLLLAVIGFTSTGHTEAPISAVKVGVQYSDFTAVSNLKLSLKNQSTGTTFLCTTDAFGQCSFPGIIPGSYRISTELNSSTLLAESATYQKVSSLVNVQRSDKNYNASLDTFFLTSITLVKYPRILTFQAVQNPTSTLLTSAPSGPAPIPAVNLFFASPDGRQVSTKSDKFGVVRVGFQSTDTNIYTFTIGKEGLRPAVFDISPSNVPTMSYVGLQPTNATLTVNLIDYLNYPRPLSSTESGWVSCYSQNGALGGYSKSFVTGSSALKLPIGDGSYRCRTTVSGFPDYSVEAVIPPGAVTSVSVPLLDPDSSVRINFQTTDGMSYPIQTTDRAVFCMSENGIYSKSYPVSVGASYVDIALVEGAYTCKMDLPNVTTSEAEIEAISGASTSGTIVITIPNASMTVSMISSTTGLFLAAPASNQVQLSCVNSITNQSFFKSFNQGESTTSLGLLSGSYTCRVNFPGYQGDPTTVNLAVGENAARSLFMEQLVSYIEFNLKDSSGGTFVVPPLGKSGAQISCANLPEQSRKYNALLRPGDSTARVNLNPGKYRCSVISDFFASNPLDMTVPSSTPLMTNISIIQYSTKVTFTLQDSAGLPAVPPYNSTASIHCSDPGGRSLNIPVRPNSSTAEMNFGKGDYSCSVTGPGIGSEKYNLSVTGYDSVMLVNIEVKTGDSGLTVDLFNPEIQQPVLIGPGQYGELSCWNPNNGLQYSNSFNTNTSVTTLYLPAGSYDCSVYLAGYASSQFRVTTQAGVTTPRRVTVAAPDSSIKVNLLSGSTSQPFPIPAGSSAFLNCRVDQREIQGTFFATLINAGDTSATLGVRAGRYRCSVWLPEYGASDFIITTTSGATSEASTRIYPQSTAVNVSVVHKETGQLVESIPLRISAYIRNDNSANDRLRHWQEVATNNGTAILNLIANQEYDLDVRLDDSLDPDSTATSRALVLSNDLIRLKTGSSGTSQSVTIEAYETTTFIEVSLLYPDGTRVDRGWAEISTVPSSESEEPDWSGERIRKGSAKIAAIAGKSYKVNGYPALYGKTEWITKKSALVTPVSGETNKVVLTLAKPDYELKVDMEIKGTPPSSTPSVFCYLFDGSGRQSFSEADANLHAVLPLVLSSDTQTLEVSCSAFYPDTENENGLSFWGSASYVPSPQTSSGTVKIDLNEYGRFYDQEAYTFDAAYGATFTLPDGTTSIEIPANAVANSGTATMYVGSPTGYSFDKENFPLCGFEIKFQVDGKIVSDMSLPVTLRFQIDDVQLAKFGGSIDKLKAGSFDDGSRIWKEDAIYSYDASTKVLSVKVTHFTVWGLLVDLLAKLTGSPTPTATPSTSETATPGNGSTLIPYDLKAKLIKKGNKPGNPKAGGAVYSYKICWKAPLGLSSSTTYELQMLFKPKSKKNRKTQPSLSTDIDWSKAKITKSKKTCVNRELKAGTAYARVRIKDGEYSSSISFTAGR